MGPTFIERLRSGPAARAPRVFEGPAQVRAYWEGLRKDGQLPSRAALDPRGLDGALDRVFLADRIGRGVANIRIAGSGLAEFAGLDPRGLPLSCLFGNDSRALLSETLEQVFAGAAIAELDLGADRGTQGTVIAQLLLLPLSPDRDTRQVMGVVGFQPEGGKGCKFQILTRRAELLPLPAQASRPSEPGRRSGHLSLVHSVT
jgi:hypothetical protein